MNRCRTDEINAKGFVDLTHPDYKQVARVPRLIQQQREPGGGFDTIWVGFGDDLVRL